MMKHTQAFTNKLLLQVKLTRKPFQSLAPPLPPLQCLLTTVQLLGLRGVSSSQLAAYARWGSHLSNSGDVTAELLVKNVACYKAGIRHFTMVVAAVRAALQGEERRDTATAEATAAATGTAAVAVGWWRWWLVPGDWWMWLCV